MTVAAAAPGPVAIARTGPRPAPAPHWSRDVRRHALSWLVGANLVGLLLASELLWPSIGDALAPFTYGRWMPLHLNWQLYGWCALPLIGALLRWILPPLSGWAEDRQVRLVLAFWSAALALGGISWLGGLSSGKVFLDWHGWARPLLPIAMLALWTLLAAHVWWGRAASSTKALAARASVLAPLVAVPPLLYWAAGRDVYPAINPHSGGATGTSLLGSTLAVVAIFVALPAFLGVPRRPAVRWRPALLLALAAAGSGAVYLVLDKGSVSHHQPMQMAGLAVLLVWIPLLIAIARCYRWSTGSRLWLRAAAGWWAALVVTGWITFLPGVSERLKFTNALVGHAHLAMAGLVTSVGFVILNELAPTRPLRRGFWLWQGGAVLHVAVLLIAGWFEAEASAAVYGSQSWLTAVYSVRGFAGVLMTAGSWLAWREA